MSILTQQYGKQKQGLIASRVKKIINHELTWHDTRFNRQNKIHCQKRDGRWRSNFKQCANLF